MQQIMSSFQQEHDLVLVGFAFQGASNAHPRPADRSIHVRIHSRAE